MDVSKRNKVDMILDDIIKLNKKGKRQQAKEQAQGRGRGLGRGKRGISGRGRGGIDTGSRGRARGSGLAGRARGSGLAGRGRGRGNVQNNGGRISGLSMHGVLRGRIAGRGRVGGRGRSNVQQTTGFSPLNRQNSLGSLQNLQQRGRGRGNLANLKRGKNLVFTNSAKKKERHLKVKEQAVLLREKDEAFRNLQQAQKNMQTVNKAIQQSARENIVNQKRGLAMVPLNGAPSVPGRKKLLTGLMNKNISSSMPNLSSIPNRQFVNTSVTITNQTAGNKRRQWRTNRSDVTMQLGSLASSPPAQKSSIVDQLKMLKPSMPTMYKFQKNMFAVPSTSLSLNDRFSSSSSSSAQSDAGPMGDGRKVYL